MRLKGISWAEQNFEKVIAGVFAVAALGVMTYQFAGKSASVKVGSKEVPIDQAYDEVAAMAKTVKGRVEQPEPPNLPDPQFKTPLDDFLARYKGHVSPTSELAFDIGGRGDALKIDSTLPGGVTSEYAKLKIPAPGAPVAESYMSTISPAEPERSPEVLAILPTKVAPFDLPSVTVESTFDSKQFKSLLAADPDGAGPIKPIQRNWIEAQGNMQILAIELDREELRPDGTWGNATKVKQMPGRLSLAPQIAEGVKGAEQLHDLVQFAGEHAAELRRPDFYDLWIGEGWEPPADRRAAEEATNSGGVDGKAQALARIKPLEKKLAFQQERRAKMGPETGAGGPGGRDGRPPEPPPPPRQGGGGGGGGGGGKRSGGGSGERVPEPDQPKQYTDAERRKADRTIADLQSQLETLRKEAGVEAAEPMAAAPIPTEMRGEPGVLDSDSIRLWAHDVTVERGKTYRYRVTLVFPNPLFGKGAVMAAEQAEMARDTLVRSEPSDWSDKVSVDEQVYCFITSARPARGAGNGGAIVVRNSSATAEFYEFTMGYWRRGAADVEPGDRLQGEIKVPDLTKLAVVGDPNRPGEQPNVLPGGGKAPAGGGRQNQAVQPAVEPPVVVETLPTIPKKIGVNAVLLSVDSAPLTRDEARRDLALAYLGWDGGRIEPRFPDQERAQKAYARVSQSAEAAKAAGLPKAPDANAPGRDEMPDSTPSGKSPAGPGGGGGGGGG